jgi:bacteriorhodopsin
VERSPLQWAFYGLGFVATIVALLYFNNLARRALAVYSGDVDGTAIFELKKR